MKTSEGSKSFARESQLTPMSASFIRCQWHISVYSYSRVKIFYVAPGAVTLLGQEEGLDYLDKARTFMIVDDEMT